MADSIEVCYVVRLVFKSGQVVSGGGAHRGLCLSQRRRADGLDVSDVDQRVPCSMNDEPHTTPFVYEGRVRALALVVVHWVRFV